MNGFGFIEYEDAMDARDVVPGMSTHRLTAHEPQSSWYLRGPEPTIRAHDLLTFGRSRSSFPYVISFRSYDDPNHSRPGLAHKLAIDGSDFKGERLTVQFARGPRRKENFPGPQDRPAVPRPRRTMFRMQISGLPETSWQVSSPSPFLPGCPGSLIFPWTSFCFLPHDLCRYFQSMILCPG